MALIAAAEPVPAAAVFTRNRMAAPPVSLSRRNVASGLARAVIVNAGNANACTGPRGEADAEAMAGAVAEALGCDPGDVLVASTGVIGVPMPMDAVLGGVREAVAAADRAGGGMAAEAIMTTDTFVKETAVRVECEGRGFTVGGMAKGSGMIRPDMATMLAFVTTDAPLTPRACDAVLRAAVAKTFNRITVDSDTSTNDMCVLLASGAEGGEPVEEGTACFAGVLAALTEVCERLAIMVARDGEGATKLITVDVRGAATDEDAAAAAFAIADSPLVKTAIFGADANWGRVAMAVGKSEAAVDPAALDVRFAGILTCRAGVAQAFDEEEAAAALARPEVSIEVDLHLGEGRARVWTCDLTYDYVRINGDYRT